MEQKAWIDVKSPRFFIWKAIQYIGVIGSGVKTLIPPTYMQNIRPLIIADIVNVSELWETPEDLWYHTVNLSFNSYFDSVISSIDQDISSVDPTPNNPGQLT
jgi:hypothetical protein